MNYLHIEEAIKQIPTTEVLQEDCWDDNLRIINEDYRSHGCSYGTITCPYMINYIIKGNNTIE